jgi:hypothetical protein
MNTSTYAPQKGIKGRKALAQNARAFHFPQHASALAISFGAPDLNGVPGQKLAPLRAVLFPVIQTIKRDSP